ncbi:MULTISPECIES: hypothetical protein [Mycobacterium avium complex (MAC)]|uniref:hypothetical protein n=1 Tax=Mycobacterium avium complex (MAC) TaxID=120793 RepID=UPI0009FCFEAE|nr:MULTISPECIES: hypothetical protein [Mycobacterium avium complex (MAC)]UCN12613.1 hypothetical protein LFT50_29415 [Mycobacterium intracellulare subsp. chimaera]
MTQTTDVVVTTLCTEHLHPADTAQVREVFAQWLDRGLVDPVGERFVNFWTTYGVNDDGTHSIFAEQWLRAEPDGEAIDGSQELIGNFTFTGSAAAWALCRAFKAAVNDTVTGADAKVGW